MRMTLPLSLLLQHISRSSASNSSGWLLSIAKPVDHSNKQMQKTRVHQRLGFLSYKALASEPAVS